MIEIHPLRIAGRWREGFALDVHTTRSVYLGEDEFGQPQYDTERSPAGELLFQLSIVPTSRRWPRWSRWPGFVRGRWPAADVVVPVPPSRPRPSQPVLLLLARPSRRALGFRSFRRLSAASAKCPS